MHTLKKQSSENRMAGVNFERDERSRAGQGKKREEERRQAQAVWRGAYRIVERATHAPALRSASHKAVPHVAFKPSPPYLGALFVHPSVSVCYIPAAMT